VKILFFAKARELSGCKESFLCLPNKISYGELLENIASVYNLDCIKQNIILSKNQEVCEIGDVLTIVDQDEIAVIPPLSGG